MEKIVKYSNKNFGLKILEIKINKKISPIKDERYLLIVDNGIIKGIKRVFQTTIFHENPVNEIWIDKDCSQEIREKFLTAI